MSTITKDGEIILAVGQRADPGKCGSCKFFSRYDDYRKPDALSVTAADALGLHRAEYDHHGDCNIKLPPLIGKFYAVRDDLGDTLPRRMNDTDGCDLHQHTGKVYIVSDRVKP